MNETREFLQLNGLPGRDLGDLPSSAKRFPDGAQYRVEIPSVEGVEAMEAVFGEAVQRGVTVHRVSQGSGALLHTDDEMAQMAQMASAHDAELSLFARPLADWDTGAGSLSQGGGPMAAQARGADQLVYVLEDIRRIADAGIRSVLITDLGVLTVAHEMRAAGVLPADMCFKISVLMGLSNPASIRLAERSGADTYNVPTDLSLAQLAAIRAAIDIPIDIYVESPDDLGGFVRHYEIAEIVRVAAPVYLKFGLRKAPHIYPSGTHLTDTAVSLSRERVRRAQIGLDMLARLDSSALGSALPAKGLAVPVPAQSVAGAPA